MSASEKLPKIIDPELAAQAAYSAKEAWRVFEIMAEFVESTERLNSIRPAVSIFGSARTPTDMPTTCSLNKLRGNCRTRALA